MIDASLQNPAAAINAGPASIAGHGAGEPGTPFRGILIGGALSLVMWAGIIFAVAVVA